MKLHTNLAMKKANQIRNDFVGDYRHQMTQAIREAYSLKNEFEERMMGVNADYAPLAQAYLKGNTVEEMELEYLIQNDVSKVTSNKLLDMGLI